ncbi:hypothetical protein NC653_011699 [Populus alba x Populus x berolinensis]|uniref:Uncharacterized protein n=1 Tax=Populus alba x Populus x berolinensis TaxID=444605 RepID=A0AAD6R2X1_9ROSI|nr:hypothetical protein NC653_011699 [Populus alba x Populus x berolinensis]
MELHQILFDWPKCVNDWEMLWPAVVASCSHPILTSKQSSEKVLRLVLDGQRFFLLEPKSWVSSLNISV